MTVNPQPLSAMKGVAMMVYGIPGAGKTRLIGTGESTLIIHPPTDHTDSIQLPADVEEVVVEDWSKMLEVFQWVYGEAHEQYNWIWLDSISLFQEHGLDDVFADAIARKPERAQFGPDKGEYGINMNRLAKWVRDMVALAKVGQINFGITAHPFEWWDPTKEEDVWAPYVQGKNMSPRICGYMNIVAMLQVNERDGEDPQRVLTTDAPGFVGKDQFDCFPQLKSGRHGIIDPTMPKIESAIKSARRPAKRKPKNTKRASKSKARRRR